MTRAALQARYPRFKVVSQPAQTCQVCGGHGEFVNRRARLTICLCVCLPAEKLVDRGRLAVLFHHRGDDRLVLAEAASQLDHGKGLDIHLPRVPRRAGRRWT